MPLQEKIAPKDYSGSIAAGGTAQDVYTAQQAPARSVEFYNTSDTAMYIDFGRPATSTQGIPVPAGAGWYAPNTIAPAGRMSVLCATTGKAFVCKTF